MQHVIFLLFDKLNSTVACAVEGKEPNAVLAYDPEQKPFPWVFIAPGVEQFPSDLWSQLILCLEEHFGLAPNPPLSTLRTSPDILVQEGQAYSAKLKRPYVFP